MFLRRRYGLFLNIIAPLILLIFSVACGDHYKQVELEEFDGKFPDESSENMVITFSDSGQTSFVIKTPLMNRYSEDTNYFDCPKGITVISYNEAGEQQAILTADYAVGINNSIYQASENVVIHDIIQDETIETEQIIWDQRGKKIYSVVLVKQTRADGSVNWGDGFVADERFTKYTITHPRGEMVSESL